MSSCFYKEYKTFFCMVEINSKYYKRALPHLKYEELFC